MIITDINNCSDSATYDILEPDTISISQTSTNVSCADVDGTISVVSSGGTGLLVPSWTSSNTTFVDPGVFSQLT